MVSGRLFGGWTAYVHPPGYSGGMKRSFELRVSSFEWVALGRVACCVLRGNQQRRRGKFRIASGNGIFKLSDCQSAGLFVALEEVLGEGFEGGGLAAEGFEGVEGAVGELGGDFAGFFEADEGGIGGFLGFGVFAGGFAELFAGLGDVED